MFLEFRIICQEAKVRRICLGLAQSCIERLHHSNARRRHGRAAQSERNWIIRKHASDVLDVHQGALQKVVFVIKEATLDETPIERFIFDFEWLMDRAELAHDEDWL